MEPLSIPGGSPFFRTASGSSNGASVLAVTSKTTTYTATTADDVILVSTASAAWTLSLYTAVGNNGRRLYIKKTESSVNALTIDPSGTETIDGALTMKMASKNDYVIIVSDGSNWQVLDNGIAVSLRYYACTTSLVSGTAADVTYNTKDWDTHSMLSGATITIPAGAGGRFAFIARIQVGSSWVNGNAQQFWAEKNGGTTLIYGTWISRTDGTTSNTRTLIATGLVNLADADTFKIRVLVEGTTPTVTAGNNGNTLDLYRISN